MKSKRVLVAEDDRVSRMLVVKVLEKDGYEILQAENGEDALSLLRTEQPDCLLLDLQMPRVDGMTVVRTLRDNPEYEKLRAIPVLGVSGTVRCGEDLAGKGLDDWMTKPVDIGRLRNWVAHACTP